MSLSLRISLERVGHRDGSIAQELSVHRFQCCIRRFERGEIDEGESFGGSRVDVSHDFGYLKNDSERTECVVEEFLVDFGVEISDENVCSDVHVLLVG